MGNAQVKPDVTIVGGGMITGLQILPSIYQLQRLGMIGRIKINALDAAPLKALAEDPSRKEAFPGQTFAAYPDFEKVDPEERFPELFKEVVAALPPRNVVVTAVPDQLVGGAVRSPRWQARPNRLGWARPWPSAKMTSGVVASCSRAPTIRGDSRKDNSPGTYGKPGFP